MNERIVLKKSDGYYQLHYQYKTILKIWIDHDIVYNKNINNFKSELKAALKNGTPVIDRCDTNDTRILLSNLKLEINLEKLRESETS